MSNSCPQKPGNQVSVFITSAVYVVLQLIGTLVNNKLARLFFVFFVCFTCFVRKRDIIFSGDLKEIDQWK